jgi:putative transposase
MRATRRSAHDGIGDRKKSLGSVELPLEQKRGVIAMLAKEYPVSVVCEIVECARSSYYHRPTSSPDAGLQRAIEEVAAAWPRYGYRRVTHQLRREGWTVNHKRVARMMRDLGLQAQRKPKPRTTTTDSRHAFPRYPNLVEQLEIVRPEQVWVSDITYIGLREEFV